MSALLEPRLQVQGDLFPSDPFRRPPEMPVFRDEPEPEAMPAKKPKIHEPEKPLPFYHWSNFASLRDARLRCAERSLSESDSDDVKLAIMREALDDFSVPVVSKPWVPLKMHQKRGGK